ncbi:MAG: ATP-binding cassette domain-containing protein [Flavobacteriales bacterium]|nr:ATP-binding cassette domain-containing protein [Flavobacteriales bacterium]
MENVVLQLQDVDVYQQSTLVLSKVDLTVNKGEFVYLIGKTGSGKSSLLRSLYLDLDKKIDTGHVVGYDLNKIKNKQIPLLRRKIGVIFQDFKLLMDRSVEQNLHFVLQATGWKDKAKMKNRIEEVLEDVGLATKGFKMPHQLSGGEQQRIGIARALLNDPELVIADEPTGNLDPETSSGILRLLYEISKAGRSVIIATHDYSIMNKFPGRMVKCEDGKIVELASDHTI